MKEANQKKINWISSEIRETKIQLHRQYKELNDILREGGD